MPLSSAMSERGLMGEMDVGHHRGLGDARIDDDECAGFVPGVFRSRRWHRIGMVVRDVRADQQNDVGGLHVSIGPGRTVGAEGELVAGDGGGHAEGGVAVVVGCAKAKLHELAQSVELLGQQLAGADDAERLVAVAL